MKTNLHGETDVSGKRGRFGTPELERAWVEESHRRMKLIASGDIETYPAEEVIAELKAEFTR